MDCKVSRIQSKIEVMNEEENRIMKIVSIADVKKHLSAYLRDEASVPFIITRNGRPAGVLLPVEDEEEIERLVLAYSPRLRALLHASREEIEMGEGVDHEVFWENVESDSATPVAKN